MRSRLRHGVVEVVVIVSFLDSLTIDDDEDDESSLFLNSVASITEKHSLSYFNWIIH